MRHAACISHGPREYHSSVTQLQVNMHVQSRHPGTPAVMVARATPAPKSCAGSLCIAERLRSVKLKHDVRKNQSSCAAQWQVCRLAAEPSRIGTTNATSDGHHGVRMSQHTFTSEIEPVEQQTHCKQIQALATNALCSSCTAPWHMSELNSTESCA